MNIDFPLTTEIHLITKKKRKRNIIKYYLTIFVFTENYLYHNRISVRIFYTLISFDQFKTIVNFYLSTYYLYLGNTNCLEKYVFTS